MVENGYNIELIPPSQIEGMRTPDMIMNGAIWEMKSPDGGSKRTIKNNMQNAKHQACNMILDLRRCKAPEEQALIFSESAVEIERQRSHECAWNPAAGSEKISSHAQERVGNEGINHYWEAHNLGFFALRTYFVKVETT